MFYQVRDRKFTNKFLASQHAVEQGLELHFNLYDSAFNICDWSQEPHLSWDQLLDMRARQIEAKNKPIVLNFSGGTDSYTVYKVFERNNIHIDILNIRLHPGESENNRFRQVYEFLNQGIYDPLTRIVTRTDSADLYRDMYSSPYWIFEKGTRYHWGAIGSGDYVAEKYLSEILGTDDFISIIGLEKPRILFQNNRVYSTQDDENYPRVMANSTLDCFYISPDLPELHVKQSYMLLNYIKSLKPSATCADDLAEFNNMHDPWRYDWLDYSIKGCGRFGDINMSSTQHRANFAQQIIIPSEGKNLSYNGRNNDWWHSLRDDPVQKNYIDGLMLVAQSDTGRFLLGQADNFYTLKHFKSTHQMKF